LKKLQGISEDASSGSDSDSASDGSYVSAEDTDSLVHEGSDATSSSSSTDQSDLEEVDETVGKDGTTWTRQAIANRPGPHLDRNVFRNAAGPTSFAKRMIHSDSGLSALRLFIDDTILRIIKTCTEAEASRRGLAPWSIEMDELEAFIGILFYRGLCGAKNSPVKSLWDSVWGSHYVKSVMSRDRFLEIFSLLRFDVKCTRRQRLVTDRFALISDLWYRFVTNCQQAYIPDENLTVDEQLFPSKARCPFTQYIKSKPDKFGLKFWLLTEVSSKYLCNGFPYLGKEESRPANLPLGEYVVHRLMEPYYNKGYNITCDNFFTSFKLAKSLMQKKTTLVGTMRANRRELPTLANDVRSQPLHSTVALSSDGVSLTIYKSKPSRNVIILSSRHERVSPADDDDDKTKPNTIVFYNQTKYGVDILDEMARKYSVKPACRRWPVHAFANVLDLAAINAWIVFRKVTHSKISRRVFLQNLVTELAEGYQKRRQQSTVEPLIANKRLTCRTAQCRNKTSNQCTSCQKPVCGQCATVMERLCPDCVI
jgi:hypothetical protein